jgi:hypothetical protein
LHQSIMHIDVQLTGKEQVKIAMAEKITRVIRQKLKISSLI